MPGVTTRPAKRAVRSERSGSGHIASRWQSEQTIRALLNAPPDTSLLIDPNGTILALNETARRRLGDVAAEVTGERPGEFAGACVYDFFPSELRGRRRRRNEEVVASGKPARYEDQRNGRWYDTSIHPVFDDNGAVAALAVFSREITEQKAAEQNLKRSEQTAKALLNAPTEPALLIDPEGLILALNEPAAERITDWARRTRGQAPTTLVGECIFDYFPEELREKRRSRNEEVIRSGRPTRFEDERDGRWFDTSVYPVTDPLGAVVALAVFTHDITDRKRAEESLKQLAYFDPLTRLPNRMLLEDRFAMALAQTKRAGQMLAVMSLDLDGFKAVNDKLGHAAGDALLQHVADRLSSVIRESDSLGRWGGDEFTLIVAPVTDSDEAASIAKRLAASLKAPLIMDGHRLRVSPSIGIAMYPDDGDDLKTLLRAADLAMYGAKAAGRGRFEIAGRPPAA